MPLKCKEARRAYQKAYSEANKEKIKAYREANKEKLAVKKKVWGKAYREANKEKIAVKKKAYREANKEEIAVKKKAYYQANKEKYAARAAKRRAAKRKQIPIKVRDCPIEKDRVNQIYKLRDIFTKATGVQHHVDHMWPLDKDGPHWSGNLQIITATENLRKKAKLNKDIKATVQEMLKDIKDAY
tara:strand:+ start:51 stop:605 length:555 start_codon:yes stop_codon:yes gene_type:complete